MNLRFLRTIVAISQHPTLVAAAESVGLSHSAVSLQVRALESELQIEILDRSVRPPVLTDQGHALVEHAKRMALVADDIWALASGECLHGHVMIGAVHSTVTHLVAPALAQMSVKHPELRLELRTGLSSPLIRQVVDRDIDTALVTEPGDDSDELFVSLVCNEPFELVTSRSESCSDLKELLTSRPFIWFDRRSWLTRQVEMFLIERDIHVRSAMEVDSIEAVEALVGHDLGVSILPRRVQVPIQPGVKYLTLGDASLSRRVALVTRKRSPRQRLATELHSALQQVLANEASIDGHS